MDDLIARLAEGSPDYQALLDPRIQALVAFAPWGGDWGVFTPSALAGILYRTPFVDIGLDEWDEVMQTNIRGLFLCNQQVVAEMLK